MLGELATRDGKNAPVHLIGVGGIGVSSIARIFHGLGHAVSGSDQAPSPVTDELRELGVRVAIGHDADHVPEGCGLVVCSAAIRPGHPELEAARARGIPVLKYAQVLGRLMAERGCGIAVAGTHGKTTTTAMVAHVLVQAGLDPTMVLGGRIPALGGTCRVGRSDLMVAEACEYDRSFLNLCPKLAVVTNIEADHLDYYRDLDEIREAFRAFATQVPLSGRIFVCSEDPKTVSAVAGLAAPIETYAIDDPDALWRAEDLDLSGGRPVFTLTRAGFDVARVELAVPGRHNALNALAAIAVAVACGVPAARAARAIGGFTGVDRRFQVVGTAAGATVIDDYAHHPTEIRAVLRAARERYPGARLHAVFQPHQHSRTRRLLAELAEALALADAVVLPEIYASRDSDADRRAVSSEDLLGALLLRGAPARHIPDFEAIEGHVRETVGRGDVVLTLGAGDVYRLAHDLVAHEREWAAA